MKKETTSQFQSPHFYITNSETKADQRPQWFNHVPNFRIKRFKKQNIKFDIFGNRDKNLNKHTRIKDFTDNKLELNWKEMPQKQTYDKIKLTQKIFPSRIPYFNHLLHKSNFGISRKIGIQQKLHKKTNNGMLLKIGHNYLIQ